MSLYLYEQQWRNCAHEFAQWVPATDRRKARALVVGNDDWGAVKRDDLPRLERLIGQSQSPFRKDWAKIDPEQRPRLLVQLVYLCLLSASRAAIAEDVQTVIGMPYRKGLQYVAPRLFQQTIAPSRDALLDALGGA